jgi:glycosyltransferase involved in cell wall biosynthesis
VILQELGTVNYLPELAAHYAELTRVVPLCNEVAALSPSLASEWQGVFRLSRPVRVLPLIYDDPGVPTRTRCAAPVVFGFAARLERGKGPDVLLQAFARVRARTREVRLRMSGVGPLQGMLREQAAALAVDAVCDLVGYTPETAKRDLLESFDVLVLPTLAEGTPQVLVETMALGLPIIASRVGGIPDMLGEDAATLVPPGDVDALTSAMDRLAGDAPLRVRLGMAARSRYERIFHPDAVLPALVAEYERAIAHDPTRRVVAGAAAHPWSSPISPLPGMGSR